MARGLWLVALVCGLLAGCTPAQRERNPAGSARDEAGDAALLLAASCTGCHDGSGGITRLDALSPQSIAAALLGFRTGEREGTLMNRIARGYDDRQIAMLARHFGRP